MNRILIFSGTTEGRMLAQTLSLYCFRGNRIWRDRHAGDGWSYGS